MDYTMKNMIIAQVKGMSNTTYEDYRDFIEELINRENYRRGY